MSLTNTLSDIRSQPEQRLQYGLIAAWTLAMIALPIFKWVFGADVIPRAVTFALLVQFAAVTVIMVAALGWRRPLVALALVAVSTWAIEFIGSSTGFPFGSYDYTDALQPQLGHVPLLIPLAWFMMMPPAWAVAQQIAGHLSGRARVAAYVGLSAVAITAWDLFLDPQMVEWGFWEWEQTAGGYFGVPWSNYAGWLLTGVVVTLLVRPYRYELPIVPLLTVYGVVWFLQSIGLAVFWGQPGPALVGFLAMGALLLWAGLSYHRERTT